MAEQLARLLAMPAAVVYPVVGLLVLIEDALFIGFVVPGETAAIVGGVAASAGHVSLSLMVVVVVAAAVIGDSIGYVVGSRLGPRLLATQRLRRHEPKLAGARAFLQRRGGPAVLLARGVAFLRAVMPALAGIARMPYRTFLLFNALGGLLWGVAVVLLGYLAGTSYRQVERLAGPGVALVVGAVVLIGLLAWHLRRRRAGLEG